MRNGLFVAPLCLLLSAGSLAHAGSLEPGSVYLKVTRPRARGAIKKVFAEVHKATDLEVLKKVLPTFIEGGEHELGSQVQWNLRAMRKPGKAARSLLLWLDQDHSAGEVKGLKFAHYVTELGRLNAAILAAVPAEIKDHSEKTLAAIQNANFEADVAQFEPTTEKSFQKFLGSEIERTRKMLSKEEISADTFHDIRKVMRALYFTIHYTDGLHDASPALKEAERILDSIGNDMNTIHEKQEKEGLQGKVDYDKLKMEIPTKLRADIETVLAGFRLTLKK